MDTIQIDIPALDSFTVEQREDIADHAYAAAMAEVSRIRERHDEAEAQR